MVATLGERPEYLREMLGSIRSQSVPSTIAVVAPPNKSAVTQLAEEFGCHLIPDPGSLTSAINLGVERAWEGHDFINWLNDDDLLEAGSLEATTSLLDADPSCVCAYGACRYIDDVGQELWVNRAGPWAERILCWGPDLIPQPGMLIRSRAWKEVGGLDESYSFAFDLDLLLKLKKMGRLVDVNQVVSSFRWHPESLTVGDRATSIWESERARRAALKPWHRAFAWIWERPVRFATRVAAREVQRRAT